MKRLRYLFLMLAAGLTQAGDTVELSAMSPRNPAQAGTLSIARVEAEVNLNGVLAETQMTLTLTTATNAGVRQRMEGRLVFPLPPHCVVTGAALDVGAAMRTASVTSRSTAKQAYDAVVSKMLDPCLVQLMPDGRVSVQVFPFEGETPRKLRLEFAQTVAPGGTWRFPLKFDRPVPEAVLKRGGNPASEERRDFTGDWNVAVPVPGEAVQACPDGNGRWVFQTVTTPSSLAGAPRLVMLVADASLLYAGRDVKAERALLERLFQKMGTGTVTLAAFSTELEGRRDFSVQHGKCEALLAALAGMTFEGAPRPGAVDVSATSVDLTVILSTLQAPMGGGALPRVNANTPVWVVDSVSTTPTAAARWLAAETGGLALDPRTAPADIFLFRRHPGLAAENVRGLRMYAVSGDTVLVTGELTKESGAIHSNGVTRRLVRGRDTVAGAMVAREMARADFLRDAEDNPGVFQSDLYAGKMAAPFLSETTAFIVLEKWSDYDRFRIPLPPDLAAIPTGDEGGEDDYGFTKFQKELQRPEGTAGDASVWLKRNSRYNYEPEWERVNENRQRFEWYRQALEKLRDGGDEGKKEEGAAESVREIQEAERELRRLSDGAWQGTAGPAEAAIRRGRSLQEHLMRRMEELTGFWQGAGGDSCFADPFASGDAPVDLFAGVGAGAGLSRSSGEGSNAGANFGPQSVTLESPVAAASTPQPEPPPAPAPTPPPSIPNAPAANPPQVPQTFGGGGGGLFSSSSQGVDYLHSAGGSPEERAAAEAREVERCAVQKDAVIARAVDLLSKARKAEAIRALSALALPGRDDHARLRLLAWMLQDWGEHALAMEVLEKTARRFGDSETTLRDRGVAALGAARKDEALGYLRRVRNHAGRRDAAGLEGAMSGAVRVVLECAGGDGDAALEIEGPDYELCSWRNPLPVFGGVLSFDGPVEAPEDYVMTATPTQPLRVRFRVTGHPQAVRITVIEKWGQPAEKRRVFLRTQCRPGRNEVLQIPAGAK